MVKTVKQTFFDNKIQKNYVNQQETMRSNGLDQKMKFIYCGRY